MPPLPRVTLVRRLKARPEQIYAAWTDPRQIALWWNGGVRGLAQCEPRRNGNFLVAGRTPDDALFEDWGLYTVVIPNEVLEFSWRGGPGPDSRVTMQLLALAYTTEITLVHFDLPDPEACEARRQLWIAGLDALERLLDPPA